MKYFDKANGLRSFLQLNSGKKLKSKRFAQEGIEEKKEDPYKDYKKYHVYDKEAYDRYVKEGKSSLLTPTNLAKRTVKPYDDGSYSYIYSETETQPGWLLRESDEDYKNRKETQREYLEKERAKKLAARAPTVAELNILHGFLRDVKKPDFKFEGSNYEKALDIVNNTNIIPTDNELFPGMYTGPGFDYSKPGFLTDEEAEKEYGRYCPQCFMNWWKNTYPGADKLNRPYKPSKFNEMTTPQRKAAVAQFGDPSTWPLQGINVYELNTKPYEIPTTVQKRKIGGVINSSSNNKSKLKEAFLNNLNKYKNSLT